MVESEHSPITESVEQLCTRMRAISAVANEVAALDETSTIAEGFTRFWTMIRDAQGWMNERGTVFRVQQDMSLFAIHLGRYATLENAVAMIEAKMERWKSSYE